MVNKKFKSWHIICCNLIIFKNDLSDVQHGVKDTEGVLDGISLGMRVVPWCYLLEPCMCCTYTELLSH